MFHHSVQQEVNKTGKSLDYPLVMTNIAIENGPVEIVDFPMKNGGSFHSFLYVYQRVYPIKIP